MLVLLLVGLVHLAAEWVEVKHSLSEVLVAVAKLHDLVAEALLRQEALERVLALDLTRAVFGRVGVIARGRILGPAELGGAIILEACRLIFEESPVRHSLLDPLVAALGLETHGVLLVLKLKSGLG